MYRKKVMEEGSFSIEAAVVIPVIIFSMLSILFLGFYIRDIILVETASRAMLVETVAGNIVNIGTQNDKVELVKECLWWAELDEFVMSDKMEHINYTVSANIFGFAVSTNNTVGASKHFNVKDKLRLWKSITDEAKELFFTGGSNDGG